MNFSVPIVLAATVSMASAWNLTAFNDDSCTQATGWSLGLDTSIGCISLSESVGSILVENMPDDLEFIGSSGYACDTFHQYGGNGCYTQGQGFQSVQVNSLYVHHGNNYLVAFNCSQLDHRNS